MNTESENVTCQGNWDVTPRNAHPRDRENAYPRMGSGEGT